MIRTQRAVSLAGAALALALVLTGAGLARAATVTLSVPRLEAKAGEEVEVPITARGAKGMSALQMRLTYDPAVLEIVKDGDDPDRAVTRGKILPEVAIAKVDTTNPGRLPVVFLGGADPKKKEVYAVQEDGTLLTIRFRVSGKGGQKTALKLEKAEAWQANDMDMLVKTEPGEFTALPGEVTPLGGLPWLWILIGLGVAVFLLLLLLLLFRRRKPQPQPSPIVAGPVLPDAGVPVFRPEGAPFQHRCVQCGGILKLPAEMAGKKFQCAACGAVQVAGG